MSQSSQIVAALKLALRARRLTYGDVARGLGVSEPSVKRMFSTGRLTLDRLEAVCTIAGIRVADVARLAEERPQPITRLNLDQERDLVADPKLLLVTLLMLNGWTIEKIVERYRIDEHEVIRKLAHLDRLGMIELQPGNRVRRLVARHFDWRRGGPVATYFERELKTDFLASEFAAADEHLRFVGGQISRDSVRRIQRSIDRLAAQIDEAVDADRDLDFDDRVGIGAMFAVRPWEVPAFRKLRRDAPE